MSIQLNVVEKKVDAPLVVPAGKPDPAEKFIIVHSRDIEETDTELLREYGKVIMFDPLVYLNVPIQNLEFDYILLDLRRKEDRHYLQQIDSVVLENFNIVSICYSFEKSEEYHEEIGVENIMTKLPAKQAFKADFDRLLLQKKISKPRPAMSLFKSFLRLVKGDWK